ncbi:uncharacterized protein LOC129775991 isoform X2 [Toxorhynchites rutilus septentrionalis]|uniref:uncharacterized protein LOC129775991 isoform X2 n=1 Tax=Toxorhynchites rutilus septentrionalis TaxID=329112 RepID=UPI0024793533|nr:uncharacterized protein LOC129775991 isoform X2 [Toxorhynchites rutilus septentrionalis]
MIKGLQNSLNMNKERLTHLRLENKVLKSLNDHLNERNSRLKGDNSKQLQIMIDQSRSIQELNEVISSKDCLQCYYNECASKFKHERTKLQSEIEQLQIQSSSEDNKARPKSTPIPAGQNNNKQMFFCEIVPTNGVTPQHYWGSQFSPNQPSCVVKHRSSDPVVRGRLAQRVTFQQRRKSSSELDIYLASRNDESPQGISRSSKEWPLSSQQTNRSQYLDKIKNFIADITKITR